MATPHKISKTCTLRYFEFSLFRLFFREKTQRVFLPQVNFTAKSAAAKSRDPVSGQVAVVQPLSLSRCIAQKLSSPPSCSGSGVMTTFVPKAANSNMMTSSTIVTSFDETDEESSIKTFSRMSSEETSSLFYNMKTSL